LCLVRALFNAAVEDQLIATSPVRKIRSFRAALRMAALPSTVAFHQLRHTCATLLIEAGAPALTCAFGCGARKLGLPVPRRLLAAGSA
jgi:integrase